MENKMTPATYTAWAIKAPDGTLDMTDGIAYRTRKEAIRFFMWGRTHGPNWSTFRRRGYRCVKVHIEEKL
jgi:hypothetical protein